jgi:Tfp pilus assembly protein PilN
MSLIFTKLVLGVDWGGGAFNLVALGRRFHEREIVAELHLADPLEEGAQHQVAEFLEKHRLREAPAIVCLPRELLLVRFLDLPAEAEAQLARVVGYQIDALHPFDSGQVAWDCAVVARTAQPKTIRVMVVLAERSRLDWHQQVLTKLGLKVNSLTLVAAALAPHVKTLLPEAALVICARPRSVELLAFHGGSVCATQEVSTDPSANAGERLERELHNALGVVPVSDPAAVPLYVCGKVPSAFSEVLSNALPMPVPKLRLKQPGSFDSRSQWPALAAAYRGLVRKLTPSINLLPPEQRWQPRRGALVPVYALGIAAALLALVTVAHSWIERGLYARALDREIQRLESPAERVRRESQEVAALNARAATLEGLRLETWRKLQILQELTRLMPDDTWLQETHLGDDTVEISGFSDRAADLVPPLENSPYFSQVEFTSPITRDAQNKEIFRIRMRLRHPPRT